MSLSAYFGSLSVANLLSRMPAAAAQGMIWGLMALGVFITFRVLDIADLTVDGSFATGGAVTVMLLLAGWPSWAALLAAFVIIPAMAAGGAQLDAGGPGLMFIYLVHVMNGMAGGRIVAMVFFVCVAFAGVTSIINLYEAPVASLQERFGLKRVPATAVIHVIGLAVALCIQAIVSQWMDVVSIYICPLGALLAAVMFFWIGGKKLVLESVNLGARKPIGGWYYPLCKYVYCASVLVALVAGAALGGIG